MVMVKGWIKPNAQSPEKHRWSAGPPAAQRLRDESKCPGCGLPALRVGHRAYKAWCGENGVKHPFTSRVLVRRLNDRGWKKERTNRVKTLWRGIKLSL